MDFSSTLVLFFFSALGAFNGFILSLYFAFFTKQKSRATYFLAALIFVVSVRVIKSVFFKFYPGTSSAFIQVGLTACMLIGPFLFLYVREVTQAQKKSLSAWWWHVIPVIVGMTIIGYYLPYRQNWHLWQRTTPGILAWILFFQWLIYILLSIRMNINAFKKLFSKKEKVDNEEFWLINVTSGIALIWLAYNTSNYTSYLVGALSFSFTLYLSLILWFYKKRTSNLFFHQKTRYADKKISNDEQEKMTTQLKHLFEVKEVHRDPELKLSSLAEMIEVKQHQLSQYFNDNLGKSFTLFVNEYRVESAVKMIEKDELLTIEAIGNECGFKSNSSFYSAFKKFKKVTPAQYKKANSTK